MNIKLACTYCLLVAGAVLLIGAKLADQPKPAAKKPWTPENFKPAFTDILNKAGNNRDIRDKLTASCDSAKQTVSDEESIDIPPKVVIVFHENASNDNYHVFHLPPLKEGGNETYEYEEYLDCCYNRFAAPRSGVHMVGPCEEMSSHSKPTSKKPWNRENFRDAFTAALTEAGRKGTFRTRLTTSCDSAKQAVSEIGNIDIPTEVVIVFHECKYNDDYHIFYLPPLKPGQPHEDDAYKKYFQAAYHVW